MSETEVVKFTEEDETRSYADEIYDIKERVNHSKDNKRMDNGAFNKVNFTLIHTIRVLSEDKKPWIRHIEVLSDGSILLADRYNRQLLLYDKNGVYMKQTRLTSGPWSMAVTSENMIAVTLPDSKAIVFIFIDSLTGSHIINVNDDCRGIAFIDDKLVVNCVNNGLKILSMKGRTLKALPDYIGYMSLLEAPNNNLICSMFAEDRIVCLDLNGNIFYEVTSSSLNGPCSLADNSVENCYFIATHHNNSIHFLDENTKKTRVLLTKRDGIDRPWAIGYNSRADTLFVSNAGGKNISIFQRTDV